ncbi:MAG: hypothetical protein C0594_08275 [Marinilabiliales bacterium]|nr:MAG: hypothetical protein C0594_08275 [Marinilabiliales bacterium]
MKHIIYILVCLFFPVLSFAQLDEMEDLLENEMGERTDYATATFKSTRVINGHSVERMQKGDLDFRISHRFGSVKTGAYELFGIDHSTSLLSLEYGITDWLMLGIGRGTYKKTFSGFAKFSLLRQCSGAKNIPISASYLIGSELNSMHWLNPERDNYFSSRLSYIHQLLIARKLNRRISLQLSGLIVHRNLVETISENNDLYVAGIAGRIKITNRLAFCSEYFYTFNNASNYTNPFSIGFDIETGSHVFQIHLTNTTAMQEAGFLGDTMDLWSEGNIHIGFNITRVFTLKKQEHDS